MKKAMLFGFCFVKLIFAQVVATESQGTIKICNQGVIIENAYGVRFSFEGDGVWHSPFPSDLAIARNNSEYRVLTFTDWQINNGLWAGECISGEPELGYNGSISNLVPLVSAGTCSEPWSSFGSYSVPLSSIKSVLSSDTYYDADYRYLDTLGSRGGEYSGRILDSYEGQTQIQISKAGNATGTWSVNLKPDNTKASGVLYWMSLAAGQEFFSFDAQYLMAIGLKETGVGGALDARTTNTDGAYGAFELESYTGVSRMLVYPKFYPAHRECLVKSSETTSLISCNGGSVAKIMDPIFGSSKSDINSASMMNSIVMSGLLLRQYYDLLVMSSDYCGARAMSSEAKDPFLGMCAVAAHYNLGINGGTPSALKDKQTISDPNGCSKTPAGNSDYVGAMRKALDALAKDSKDAFEDKTIGIYDAKLTLKDIETFFWGDGGSINSPGSNGLLWHFDLGDTKEKMWNDIVSAFQIQAEHWGGVDAHISFRYDWLTLLRVAKKYLDVEVPRPVGDEVWRYINSNSGNKSCDASLLVDSEWPYIDLLVSSNQSHTVSTYDNVGLASLQWSVNGKLWSSQNVVKTKEGTSSEYTFSIPQGVVDSGFVTLFIKAQDSCRNEIHKSYRVHHANEKVTSLKVEKRGLHSFSVGEVKLYSLDGKLAFQKKRVPFASLEQVLKYSTLPRGQLYGIFESHGLQKQFRWNMVY